MTDILRRHGRKTAVIMISIIMLFMMLFPAAVNSSENDTVRVGYYEQEVFQEGASDGEVKTGYAYEYYQKLSEYTGWQYEYVYGEFGDLYQMLLDGDIDFLAGLAYRDERADLIGYPDSPMGNETYSLVKHDDDIDITIDPSSLNGKIIGVLDSAMVEVLQTYLELHSIQAQVITYRDYEPLFEAFDNHDIDILAAEGDGAYGREHAEILCPFGTSDYFLCVSRTRTDLLSQLNAAQAELAANEPNYINTLRNRYYPVSISSRSLSEAEREWLSTHNAITVGYLNDYLPFSDTDQAGEVTGLIRDLLPHMLEELGLTDMSVTYIGYDSYDAMITDLEAGTIDTAFPVGGGLYYSEESGIFQSASVISASTELVYSGDFTYTTTAR